MLSQTEGSLQEPLDVGPFTDRDHYRMHVPDDAIDVYGLLHLFSSSSEMDRVVGKNGTQDHLVFAFTSCLRFVGRFLLTPHSLDVEVDLEGMRIAPGQSGVPSVPVPPACERTKLRSLLSGCLPALALHHHHWLVILHRPSFELSFLECHNIMRSCSGAGSPRAPVRTRCTWRGEHDDATDLVPLGRLHTPQHPRPSSARRGREAKQGRARGTRE